MYDAKLISYYGLEDMRVMRTTKRFSAVPAAINLFVIQTLFSLSISKNIFILYYSTFFKNGKNHYLVSTVV